MAKAFIDDTHLTDIADAIRGKLGVATTYKPSEMADAIANIPTYSDINMPLTFTALAPSTLTYTETGTYSNQWMYSLDDGATWTNWDGSAISLATGASVQIKGSNTAAFTWGNYRTFGGTGRLRASGNCASIRSDYASNLVAGSYHFLRLFQNCTNIVDASSLVLPANTMAFRCYREMFAGCTSLIAAPALSAAYLAEGCYYAMFRSCTALTTAPSLPVTTLANYCYAGMFAECTSLTTAPSLPATTLAEGCYQSIYEVCSSLRRVEIYATSWNTANSSNWLNGVAATGDFFNLGGATIPTGVSGIPTGWAVHNSL